MEGEHRPQREPVKKSFLGVIGLALQFVELSGGFFELFVAVGCEPFDHVAQLDHDHHDLVGKVDQMFEHLLFPFLTHSVDRSF